MLIKDYVPGDQEVQKNRHNVPPSNRRRPLAFDIKAQQIPN
ncbi:protein of unknown function [Candidatus Filomicrobium marinum]|uniref:Uncharacterized protein n=1 Tax=Candidatus Filomicrobium marinum TaxID=1608628 RepID=A0A0D6JFW8_9HYPH|nr:protein of unknown function [Candidatus Filomicrobium marinum]